MRRLFLAVLLLAAACSGDDGSGSAATTTGTEPPPTTTTEPPPTPEDLAAVVCAAEPVPGSSASNAPAEIVITIFGICSRALPLVGSEFVRTRRQKRRKFVHGAPVRRR